MTWEPFSWRSSKVLCDDLLRTMSWLFCSVRLLICRVLGFVFWVSGFGSQVHKNKQAGLHANVFEGTRTPGRALLPSLDHEARGQKPSSCSHPFDDITTRHEARSPRLAHTAQHNSHHTS